GLPQRRELQTLALERLARPRKRFLEAEVVVMFGCRKGRIGDGVRHRPLIAPARARATAMSHHGQDFAMFLCSIGIEPPPERPAEPRGDATGSSRMRLP